MVKYSRLESDSVFWTELGEDEIMCLNTETGEYTGVADVGHFLWDKLGESVSFEDLVSAVVEQYDIDNATAEQDIRRFLDQLIEAKLIASD